jgi:hypothetical protein
MKIVMGLWAASLAFLAVVPVWADSPYKVAGMVQDVDPRGVVDIIRKSYPTPRARETARYHSLLFPGDHLEFHAEAKLNVELYGKAQVYRSTDSDLVIPDRQIGSFGAQGDALLGIMWPFVSSPRRAIAIYSWSRSPNEPPRAPVTADSLAPPGRQFIPAGENHIVLIWRDAPGTVTVEPEGGKPTSIDSNRDAWIDLPLESGRKRYVIAVDRPRLQWSVEVTGAPPIPPWFTEGQPTDEALRLIRAVWLVKQGPVEWRLFALTELSDLAADGDFQARQFWDGARSGELQEALTK